MTGFYKENFIDETSIAASVAATRGVKVGGSLGHVYAEVRAGKGGLSIAEGKKITVTAKEADTATGTYAANGVTVVRTMAAATTFAEDEIIAEVFFPTYSKAYAKVELATDDTSASGAVKVVPAVMG